MAATVRLSRLMELRAAVVALVVALPAGADSTSTASTSSDSVAADSTLADSTAVDSTPADSTSAAPPDTSALEPKGAAAPGLLLDFEARYDHYLDTEERCLRAGVDRVFLFEAQALALEAERLAGGGGEVEAAMALLDEAIGLLEGQCRAGGSG